MPCDKRNEVLSIGDPDLLDRVNACNTRTTRMGRGRAEDFEIDAWIVQTSSSSSSFLRSSGVACWLEPENVGQEIINIFLVMFAAFLLHSAPCTGSGF